MLLRNLIRQSASGKPIYGTPDIGFDASQIIAETATGDHGPGLLYAPALAHPTKQLRVEITSWSGTPGTLFVFENGSLLIEGQADGAYSIGYDWEAWTSTGVLTAGSDTASVQIGPQNATAPGATVTGTGTVSAGTASGEQSATAPGADVTGTGSVVGGSADGQGNATAPGADITGAGTVTGGAATGEQNATAPGATVTGTGTVTAGDATGGTSGDASAPGANVSGSGTVDGGTAIGELSATAPGADVTGTGSISAGTAAGDADGTAPGANVIGESSIIAGDAHQQAPEKILINARIECRAIIRAGVSPAMKTLVGSTVRIEIDIRNAQQELVDAPDITIAIIAPGSSMESETAPLKLSTGRYCHDLLLDAAGTWYWQVRAVSPLPGIAEGAITVSPSRFTH